MTAYAELAAATNFSFLHGASHPHDMIATALSLGLRGIGIADRNTVAGVVRAHCALSEAKENTRQIIDFKLLVGARLVFTEPILEVIAYPSTRHGWGRLTRLLTMGNSRGTKGECILRFNDIFDYLDDLKLIVMPNGFSDSMLCNLSEATKENVWLGAAMHKTGFDRNNLGRWREQAKSAGLSIIAVNDVLYATPEQQQLHDVITCIRTKSTIHTAGRQLQANSERHLKSGADMHRLFADFPEALEETIRFMDGISFSVTELQYKYPREPIPQGYTAQDWLERLTYNEASRRWPQGVSSELNAMLKEEFILIARQEYAPYFLTVHDIVAYAKSKSILCQGRGSAANSAVCYVLGITAVDPVKNSLLFSRFISEERKEPPDIDIDFEHERREEVIQYIYGRYGRERAGIAATVIHYRPRSAVREVGKALGLSEDVTSKLTSTVWGSFSDTMEQQRFREAGYAPNTPEIARLADFVKQIMKFPRHLSQHVGGFVLTQNRLDELVPIRKGAMPDRTFIEWDKDDIDALGLMKVDVLALGMLSCVRRAFDLIETHIGQQYTLDNITDDASDVYAMLCRGDTIGVFQVESRAQMNMLPRLRPREF